MARLPQPRFGRWSTAISPPTGPDDRRHPGILTEGCYHRHLALATRNELIWGDYYLFEALQILRGSLSALEV
jgi:unsaturated chondroitin disaccharide hydrolase